MGVIRGRMRARAIRKEMHDARAMGSAAARRDGGRNGNPYRDSGSPHQRHEWFTAFDRELAVKP